MTTVDTKPASRVHMNAYTLAIMLEALHAYPQSYADLVEATGMKQACISRWIQAFRKKKLVRIACWSEDSRGCYRIAEFEWAPGKMDAKRPPPQGKAESMRKYRGRLKTNPFAAGLLAKGVS